MVLMDTDEVNQYETFNLVSIFAVLMYRVYRVGQKSKPAYFCNNFVYYQPILIIFGKCTL